MVTGPAQSDSRLIEPGGLFVALPGQSVDGHDFASRAMAGGGVAVLAGRPALPFTDDVAMIADALSGSDRVSAGRMQVSETIAVARGVEAEHVPDTLAALELVRRRWAASDVVLVKGSNTLGPQSLAQQLEVASATQDHANAERNGK